MSRPPALQMPLWQTQSEWRPPRVADLPSWEGARRVGFDVETRDPQLKQLGCGARRRNSYVVGFSFAIEDGPRHYVPVRHEGGDNVEDPGQAFSYLRDNARRFKGQLVGAHLPYDLDHAAEDAIEFPAVEFFRDVQIADPLINELHASYSLEAIAGRWGLPGKSQELLERAARDFNVSPKHGLWRLPARYVGPYAEQDAALPLDILRRQEREIEEQDLWGVFNLESQLLPVLVRMRRRGVRVSEDRLVEIENWSLQQEGEALEKIRHITGVRIEVGDVWKTGALVPALQAIGIDVPKTRGRGKEPTYSIDQELLSSIDHPVADAIAWARKTNKLRGTFAASIRKHLVRGRIHATFNQLRKTDEEGNQGGAAYGRLSSENPNMQQQPARDEFAAMWRSIYLPEEGSLWCCADYSQQEPRMLVHFAELVGLAGAEAAADRYRRDPNTDNHQMMADMAGIERKPAKELFLGKCYGMGGAKLCRKLGLPTRWAVFGKRRQDNAYFEDREEAIDHARSRGGKVWEVAGEEGQAIIDQFDRRLPFVKGLAKETQEAADQRGFIRTLSGRRCRFPVDAQGSYDWTHKALNRLIQGSSADQTKRAMVELDAAGHCVHLQVHDETDSSVAGPEEGRRIGEIMAAVYELRVPFKVDIELGPSWGEAEEI